MPLYFSPVGNDQTFDANGDPLTGGKIWTYLAGSSTPAATYTDDTGSTPQSNPIELNSLGYPTLGAIWLTGGISYKFVIQTAGLVTLRTIDNISGVNDASVSQSEWVQSGFVPTYINATSFSVPGDQTAILQVGRRLQTTNTSGLVYSTISNSVFAAGITTVTVVNDSTTLDAGLSGVAYALLSADPLSVPDLPGSKITGAITSSGMTMNADRVLLRTTPGSGAIEEKTAAEAAAFLYEATSSKLQPITASVAANALTITLNPTTLDFRSTTLGSGDISTVSVASPISLVISSGSTLGSTSGNLTRLAILAINNAGTVELAVSNLAGAVNIDESALISTTAEGGAGGADSSTVIYSATARAFVAHRIVGYIEYTQATAGVYATAPSLIDVNGDSYAKWLAGYGQAWSAQSRAVNTNYTNNTGRTIRAMVSMSTGTNDNAEIQFNSVLFGRFGVNAGLIGGTVFEVPPGMQYRIVASFAVVNAWSELR